MVKRILIGTAAVLVLSGAMFALLTARSRPVLWSVLENGDPTEEPLFAIFNPFRNRAPERAAEAVLRDLKEKQVAKALARVPADANHRAYLTSQEQRHGLRRWCLENRTESGATTTLFYLTARGDSRRCLSPLWIALERSGDGWKMTRFEPWY